MKRLFSCFRQGACVVRKGQIQSHSPPIIWRLIEGSHSCRLQTSSEKSSNEFMSVLWAPAWSVAVAILKEAPDGIVRTKPAASAPNGDLWYYAIESFEKALAGLSAYQNLVGAELIFGLIGAEFGRGWFVAGVVDLDPRQTAVGKRAAGVAGAAHAQADGDRPRGLEGGGNGVEFGHG